MAAMLWNSRAKYILPWAFQKAGIKDDLNLQEEHMHSVILLSQIKKLRPVEDTGPRSLVSGAELETEPGDGCARFLTYSVFLYLRLGWLEKVRFPCGKRWPSLGLAIS